MYTLGIDIGSTTVKVAVLDKAGKILFSDYKRHFANIKETLNFCSMFLFLCILMCFKSLFTQN